MGIRIIRIGAIGQKRIELNITTKNNTIRSLRIESEINTHTQESQSCTYDFIRLLHQSPFPQTTQDSMLLFLNSFVNWFFFTTNFFKFTKQRSLISGDRRPSPHSY